MCNFIYFSIWKENVILMRKSVDTMVTCSDYIATWPTKRVQYFMFPFYSLGVKQWETTEHKKHLKIEEMPSIIVKTVLLGNFSFQKGRKEKSKWQAEKEDRQYGNIFASIPLHKSQSYFQQDPGGKIRLSLQDGNVHYLSPSLVKNYSEEGGIIHSWFMAKLTEVGGWSQSPAFKMSSNLISPAKSFAQNCFSNLSSKT